MSACHDVSPTIGIEAACTKSRFGGLSAAAFSGTTRKFGESARAQVEDTGEDSIARLEASHATSDLDHDTRQIAAQRGRKLKPEDGLKRSFRNHVIDRVQASRVDLNENFVRLGHWPRRIGERDVDRRSP